MRGDARALADHANQFPTDGTSNLAAVDFCMRRKGNLDRYFVQLQTCSCKVANTDCLKAP